MIITAGIWKGKKVKTLESYEVRPTSSKVRESIFNILQTRIQDAVVLDLFAGSGMIGFEALSRSADKVIFVEKNYKVVQNLQQNISSFDCNCKVVFSDALIALDKIDNIKFDLIFIDPPYKSDLIIPVLEKIKNNNLLNPSGIIIVEHPKGIKFDEILDRFTIFKEKKYGDTYLTFLDV